jgi:two-component system phosphate regulon response regulator OmpR
LPRLLLIDDQAEVSEVIGNYLREQGYVVTAVNDGREALRMLMGERFDGVIIDVLLPGVSGLKLADAAAAHHIPVLLMSGEPGSIERLNGNSRYPFLQKPFHLDDLELALSGMLNARVRMTT